MGYNPQIFAKKLIDDSKIKPRNRISRNQSLCLNCSLAFKQVTYWYHIEEL